MTGILFYTGFGLQLVGFTTVGLCLYSGITHGDYGKVELAQLVAGSLLFYLGNFLKGKSSASA